MDEKPTATTADEFEDEAILESLKLPDELAGFAKGRVDLVRRAIKQWTSDLIDLGGRNNLLAYRDLKRGTLDLTKCSPTALASLLQGKPVRISSLFPVSDPDDSSQKRARTIFKKASENFDERGIETLSLACGLATWTNTKSAWQPRAPVLLRRATLRPLGAAQDDFELTLLEDTEVSSTLLHLLRVEFDCEIDPDLLVEHVDGTIDETWELEATYEWLKENAKTVPGFNVEPRLILANFAYTKLPMVKDLEQSFSELVSHDLIAAIAGDRDARAAVAAAMPDPESIPSPDAVPPKNEFLILDADASQNYAINAVLAGSHLIVRGPPGTGKSQTIANLIGALSANGKKVLFVAEKRAAIEAVVKRLRQRNLGDLVVDLHGGISSRKQFAQALAKSLDAIRSTPPIESTPQLERLAKSRDRLSKYDAALHMVREPWGISMYEARHKALALDDSANDIRFRGSILTKLNASTALRVEENLEDFVGLGGTRLASSPWSNSRVESAEDVTAAFNAVVDMRRTALPNAVQKWDNALSETGLTAPTNLNEWIPTLDLLDDVAATLDKAQSPLFQADLPRICSTLAPARRGGLARIRASLLSSEYRDARQQLRNLCIADKPSDKTVLEIGEEALALLSRWKAVSSLPLPALPSGHDQLRPTYDSMMVDLEAIEEWVGADDLCDLNPEDLSARLQVLIADQTTLVNLPEIKRLRRSLINAGLKPFLEAMADSDAEWVLSFRFSWLQSIADSVLLSDPVLGGFVPNNHSKAVVDFRAEDQSHIANSPARIRRICAEVAVTARNALKEQDDILRHQANLKTRHMPVRELIRKAANVLQALKPCWVMSPLVVSQLLPPSLRFDVVIFDEASQVTPADAIPSIVRGKQLVVAGDKKQLPPTSFFMSESPEDEEELEEDLAVPIVAGTRGFESILDALPENILPWRMLEWHYRSRDERLVAFSNAHIYDRMLTTFPGSGYAGVLRHEVAPSDPTGVTNSPSPEVALVVDLTIEHMRARPEESLGVIAMGITHANRIDEAFRLRLSEDPELEDELAEFLDETKEERFFVKNLERVQGDERDAIILSVGYGKNARGSLPFNFGPLLQEGGERRLNVAVTRAKKRITLVSSFASRDMDPEKSKSGGVKFLRQYLQYMESGGENLGDEFFEKPPLNAFEVDVRDTLADKGLRLIPQYGCSGYWIDFAVQHPEHPGEFALALECDGATYHASQSARDRDRLRQEQLERLGWRFHRIWSTEWFHDKGSAVAKVMAAYEQAVSAGPRESHSTVVPQHQVPLVSARSGHRPAFAEAMPIRYYGHSLLVKIVDWIQSDGVLRTDTELRDEVIRELGYSRRGSNVVAAVDSAISSARSRPNPLL